MSREPTLFLRDIPDIPKFTASISKLLDELDTQESKNS